MGRHWTVITTGNTQPYIFDSNKRKLNVGASHLVASLPSLVSEAVAAAAEGHTSEVDVVVNVSGVANILVSTEPLGRAIIGHVTQQVLEKAPGLMVWGSVSPAFENDEDAGPALSAAYRLHGQVRSELPPATGRFPGLPFTARCGWTGLPVRGKVRQGPSEQVGTLISAEADTKWRVSWDALEAIGAQPGDPREDDLRSALVDRARLDGALGDSESGRDTWIAVVHVDGNGLGQVLHGLSENGSDDFIDLLKEFSQALDVASRNALRTAILATSVRDGHDHWILPLVVGGDDLTAVVHPSCVRSFVERYLEAFEDETSDAKIKFAVEWAIGVEAGLTASAGIAIVKPTHPFHGAYSLAEELCRSAKRVKTLSPGRSALDIQVFHESVGRTLSDVRADLEISKTFSLHPGPLLLGGPESAMGSADVLRDLVHKLGDGALTSSERHRLRTRLTNLTRDPAPSTGFERAVEALRARVAVVDPSRLGRLDDGLLSADLAPYLVPAMDLLDVEAS